MHTTYLTLAPKRSNLQGSTLSPNHQQGRQADHHTLHIYTRKHIRDATKKVRRRNTTHCLTQKLAEDRAISMKYDGRTPITRTMSVLQKTAMVSGGEEASASLCTGSFMYISMTILR